MKEAIADSVLNALGLARLVKYAAAVNTGPMIGRKAIPGGSSTAGC